MKFLHPEFLYALSALLIPIIIHLFNFRRYKKLYFPSVRFLRQVEEESKSRNRLKHLLILASRLLALAALIFAFAQPFKPALLTTTAQKTAATSIYVDNSFSMDAVNEDGRLIDLAKQFAYNINAGLDKTSENQLLTNEFKGKSQRLYIPSNLDLLVDEVVASPISKKLSEIIGRQQDALKNSELKNIYLISDFQEILCDAEATTPDSSSIINVVVLQNPQPANVSIDSVWFEDPYRKLFVPEELHVKLTNHSSSPIADLPLKLTLNGSVRVAAQISLAADEVLDTAFVFNVNEAGFQAGIVTIDDYPIIFDNSYYFAYTISEKIPVLHIRADDSPTYLAQLFADDSVITYTEMSEKAIDYSAFSTTNLLLLEGLTTYSSGLVNELKKAVDNGVHVVVLAPEAKYYDNYAGFIAALGIGQTSPFDSASSRLAPLPFDDILFQGVFEKRDARIDLPRINKISTFKPAGQFAAIEVLQLVSGQPVLTRVIQGKGEWNIFGTNLQDNSSNFGKHALFVPIFYNLALYSSPHQELQYTLGNSVEIAAPFLSAENAGSGELIVKGENTAFRPELRKAFNANTLVVHDQITKSGIYEIVLDGKKVAEFAMNYNRLESNPKVLTGEEVVEKLQAAGWQNVQLIEANLDTFGKTLKDVQQGNHFWWYCVLAAFLFFIVEICLIKWFK